MRGRSIGRDQGRDDVEHYGQRFGSIGIYGRHTVRVLPVGLRLRIGIARLFGCAQVLTVAIYAIARRRIAALIRNVVDHKQECLISARRMANGEIIRTLGQVYIDLCPIAA